MASPKQHSTYDIYNFLEKEVQRLEKVDNFISVRMANLIKYSQTAAILQDQQKLRQEREAVVMKQCLNSGAPLQQNFKNLWPKVMSALNHPGLLNEATAAKKKN
jgi:hypothetical protein